MTNEERSMISDVSNPLKRTASPPASSGSLAVSLAQPPRSREGG